MAIVVQKYGGTSVANLEKIEKVAEKGSRTRKAGNDVVVVLSAIAGETDRLIRRAREAAGEPDKRECDALISTGEQVTVTLLAMILRKLGYKAKSLLGFQVKIHTDQAHAKARIISVDTEIILKELNGGSIVVVAGFQGVDDENNITSLGRGGSDTSAVALAGAPGGGMCDIYTGGGGGFT